MIVPMMPRKIFLAVAGILASAALLQAPAFAEQWVYAMQTGHGNHSIQVDVDSITQKSGYVAARLLYEYYPDASPAPSPGSKPLPRSALVDGAFDCKAKSFQVLGRTEYAASEAQGVAGAVTRSALAAGRWQPASGNYETAAIIDWVCGVAANRRVNGQAGSMP
jgi:hypothetical protein